MINFHIEYAYEEGGRSPLPRIQQFLNAKHAELRQANPRGFLDEFEARLEIFLEEAASLVRCKVDFVTDTDGVFLARFYPEYLKSFPDQKED